MRSAVLVRGALLFGGAATAMIGVGHIFMPAAGYAPSIAQGMTPDVRDHFYFLGTYAICGFLLSFATLSLYFSAQRYGPASLVVCSVLAMFWSGRVVLELIYPSSCSGRTWCWRR
jgi:predicted anti-sigma-YlaC factor YlaD